MASYKFTNEDIFIIKKDFKDFIRDFEDSDLNVISFFIEGYISGLKDVYGDPIEIQFISDIRDAIEKHFKFLSDNLSLQGTPFEKDLRNATLDKIKEIIMEVTIIHKFTNEEIIRIKKDFGDMVTYLEESYNLWGVFPVLTYYINGYIKGLEKAYGIPIGDVQFISDIGDILKERVILLKEEEEKQRHGAIALHEQYFPMLEDINKDFWNRIKRVLL